MNWCLFPQSYGNFKGNKRPIPTLEAARNWSQEAGSACLWRQFCWPHRMAQIRENLWVSGRPGWHGNEGDCLYIYVYIYIIFISIHAHIIYMRNLCIYIYLYTPAYEIMIYSCVEYEKVTYSHVVFFTDPALQGGTPEIAVGGHIAPISRLCYNSKTNR